MDEVVKGDPSRRMNAPWVGGKSKFIRYLVESNERTEKISHLAKPGENNLT